MKQAALARRVVAAYDTETTNVTNKLGFTSAFFSSYQVCEYLSDDIRDATSDTIENLSVCTIYRHDQDAWQALLEIADRADGYVPVVAVHNLSFDIYSLAPHLNVWNDKYSVRILAKSPQKPVTVTLMRDGNPYLVFWDTLVFAAKGLETMGKECGFEKAVGHWDYTKIRTPETPLTDEETYYACTDCLTLLCWLGYYFRREPLLDPEQVAYKLCTKTGAVRQKREILFSHLKGEGLKMSAGKYWTIFNQSQCLRDDEALFTFHACTRGGFTFASRECAGLPIDAGEGEEILAYDATSQHPAQMVSHFVPVDFQKASTEILQLDAQIIQTIPKETLYKSYARPFPVAFDACFDFTNIRLKPGTVWARDGISPLAYARLQRYTEIDESDFAANARRDAGYADSAPDGCEYAFGKVYSAPRLRLWLTELDFWIICQVFDFDSFQAVQGFETSKFQRPTDYSVLSVMEFYRRKNKLKEVRKRYAQGERDFLDVSDILPGYFIAEMEQGIADSVELESYYMGSKADLNSLYGIEITNEAKRDIVLDAEGLVYTGKYSADNLPTTSKACYQYGQRIVGYSRIAQVLMIEALGKHAKRVINGDTDSIKLLVDKSNMSAIEAELAKYAGAIDKARAIVTERVRTSYPQKHTELKGVGHYECEAHYTRFYSAYNKAYIAGDDWHITLAGVPSLYKGHDGERGLETWARDYVAQGHTWQETAGLVLGYNVCIDADITGLNGRSHPEWASRWNAEVVDYLGYSAYVEEPQGIGLAPMPKVIGGYQNPENRVNAQYAMQHGFVNTEPCMLTWNKEGKAEVIRW